MAKKNNSMPWWGFLVIGLAIIPGLLAAADYLMGMFATEDDDGKGEGGGKGKGGKSLLDRWRDLLADAKDLKGETDEQGKGVVQALKDAWQEFKEGRS